MDTNSDFEQSKAFDQFNGMDKRTKQLEDEVAELEAARDAANNPPPEPEVDEFEKEYSEVEIKAHDKKAAAANTAWAQKRFNEAKKAREELAKAQKEAAELRAQLAELNKPKTSIPQDEWAENNPESAAQIEARIYDTTTAQQTELEELKAKLEALEADKRITEEANEEVAATQALMSRVPDAMEIIASQDFNEWLETRPTFKQVIEGTLDVDSAEEVLKTYKFSKVASTPEELQRQQEQADIERAAEAVKSSSNSPIEKNEPKIWKESEIAAIPLRDYEKYEAEIDLAYREGRYDPYS